MFWHCCPPSKCTPQESIASGGSYRESYRLDDAWVLTCWYRHTDDVLLERTLTSSLRYVWVAPPAHFTGVWITYYVNGKKSHEIQFRDGGYFGEFIAYNSDGSKSYIQHYDLTGADGEEIGRRS